MLSLAVVRCVSRFKRKAFSNNIPSGLIPAYAGVLKRPSVQHANNRVSHMCSSAKDLRSGPKLNIVSGDQIVSGLLKDRCARSLASDGTVIDWKCFFQERCGNIPASYLVRAFIKGETAGGVDFWIDNDINESRAVISYSLGGAKFEDLIAGRGSVKGLGSFAAIFSNINEEYRGMGTSLIGIAARIAKSQGNTMLCADHVRDDATTFFGKVFDYGSSWIEEDEFLGWPTSKEVTSYYLNLMKESLPPIEITKK
jgi:hypothetical protein